MADATFKPFQIRNRQYRWELEITSKRLWKLDYAGINTKLKLFVSDKASHGRPWLLISFPVSLASQLPIRNLSNQTLQMYWGERIIHWW